MALYPAVFEADVPRAVARVAIVSVPSWLWLRHTDLSLELWPINWRAIVIGVVIVASYFGVAVAVFRPNSFSLPSDPLIWLNWIIATPIAEEILYRGITFRQLAKTMPIHRAALFSAMWFLALHIPRWILIGRIGTTDALQFLSSVFVFGLLLPYMVRSTGSLWSAIAVHVTNNLLGRALQ